MSAQSATVLVIEDEEGIRESLRDLLEDAGYRVATASDGVEAMYHLETRPPTLVILDLQLPLMNGNQIYDAMQRTPTLAKVPVLVTTSDPSRSPPGVPVLGKPINFDSLLKIVALCADGRDYTTETRPRRR